VKPRSEFDFDAVFLLRSPVFRFFSFLCLVFDFFNRMVVLSVLFDSVLCRFLRFVEVVSLVRFVPCH